jgi:excisionase family DNA binding protein
MKKMERNNGGSSLGKPGSFPALKIESNDPDLITVDQLSFYTSISNRTIFRLLSDPDFPRIRIGRRLLFNKAKVLKYLEKKFGN